MGNMLLIVTRGKTVDGKDMQGCPVFGGIWGVLLTSVFKNSILQGLGQSCHLSNILHGSNSLGKFLPDKSA